MTPRNDSSSKCPECGTTVSRRKNKCPSCGAKIDRSPKLECPSCGKLIPKKSKTCSFCDAEIPVTATKSRSKSPKKSQAQQPADLATKEPVPAKDEDKEFCCPVCDCLLLGTESECPQCGQELKGKTALRCRTCGASVSEGSRECPECNDAFKEIGEISPPATTAVTEPAEEAGAESRDWKREDSRPCSLCGTILPVSVEKCPLCATSLVEKEPETPPAGAITEESRPEPIEEPAPSSAKLDSVPARPLKKRKLKTAKVTPVPVEPETSSKGRTNGLGQIARPSKVSGTEKPAGEAFVNGTGVSNGLGAGPKGASARQTSMLTSWQFLAVLVAIIIIIPAFIFLSFGNESDDISIDGSFADWEDATLFGTRVQSSAATTNFTEWAVDTQSNHLFLYFKTQSPPMSTTDPESYYLFVDSDGSANTGFAVESIGADYMLQLSGWSSSIQSSSLLRYSSTNDSYNWNAWTSIDTLSCQLKGDRVEARANMPSELGQNARFIIVSKDASDRGAIGHTAPLNGGTLVIEQMPTADATSDGIVSKSASVAILTLKFTCIGEGGNVDAVNPTLKGASLAQPMQAFPLTVGDTRQATVSVDTSVMVDGQLVSVEILASDVESSFATVEIIGEGARAYVASSPSGIAIDGAFADWTGVLSTDIDSIPVTDADLDIDQVANVSNTSNSFFYVSVEGEMCAGTYVPTLVAKPSGSGGGGTVVVTRRTSEDVLRVYVDSDKSDGTGYLFTLNSKSIGADQMVEVKGVFGTITSLKEYSYTSSGTWVEMSHPVKAAKDDQRMEIQITAASIGASTDVDFIVETTSWKGRGDLATFDLSSTRATTRTWVVDPSTSSPWATSMSYQRKMFFDGTNHWSFFFDGTNTVCKYSMDGGVTWIQGGPVFRTPGVNETSIWYDSASSTVYVVGDTSTATTAVLVQAGTINAPLHNISWAASDSALRASSIAVEGKNTYICKDSNGFLWVLSSNLTQATPEAYQLSAYRSVQTNSTTSWIFTGQMMATTTASESVRGSIVPAGPGSDVWAIFAYTGNVMSRKYTGSWQAVQTVYAQFGSKANTDNSPPSVVVDGKGVVHVVYGTGRRDGPNSAPTIEYSHNESGLTTFTTGYNLDPSVPTGVGDYYPTISLETSTNDLYVLWLRSDASLTPMTVMAKKCVSGIWSELTVEQQTNFTKQFLTSVYSVPSPLSVCWQWTQNMTAPTEVYCDGTMVPEFGALTLPVLGTALLLVAYARRWGGRKEQT